MKETIIVLVLLCCSLATADTKVIQLLEGEKLWGGCVTDGRAVPFSQQNFERDLYGSTRGNQAQPLLLSDRGRYAWCEEPFKFSFRGKKLTGESRAGEVHTGVEGNTLRKVFQYVSRSFFPSNGQIPDERLVFPKGTWKGDDGSKVTGPCTQDIKVPLARLPHYRLIKSP